MTETNEPLPVAGYTGQTDEAVEHVNRNKEVEEAILRQLDAMQLGPQKYDLRWVAIARTHFEQAFMALNRAVFRPQRIKLPSDILAAKQRMGDE